MMLDTADNKIFFARFYDIDTICSYDNSGQLKFDVDIEMEQGYWNTSSSRLWTRIRDLMHNDIVATYNNMRQNGVSYENMMKYIYDEQIAKIPQTYYNKDYDVKYAPFADSYIGMAHGDTYEHVKRWLKQRFTFVDTLFDYAPSYNNDILTIRVNTTEEITLHLETYTPVYQHLSWYNGQMDKKKIDGKTSITFSGKVQAATDQEVLIYGGSNIKKITGIQSGNPNRLILGSATKLTELDASNCPLLSEINMNKANLSPHEYLNKVNLSNCPLLEGSLRLNNSPLIQELDIRGTNITGMNLSSSIRNLQVLRLPNTMTELTLNDASMLHTLEFDEGVALQSISMTNCNALTNVVNFDLLQTPSITLNNSYNNVAELYFRDTTNLTLSNMSNLERVIFTPNAEYETFELINVANAPDYKVTTFNCPKLSTFMTTAPYRESYNNCNMIDREEVGNVTETTDLVLSRGTGFNNDGSLKTGQTDTCYADVNFYEVKVGTTCTIEKDGNWSYIIEYNENKGFVRLVYEGANTEQPTYSWTAQNPYVRIGANNGTFIKLTRSYDKVVNTIQVKDYGNIQPNTTFTANSIDISNTQFTDVKLLCTTDTNTLKLPTTIKNFYCDSSFDLDTNYLEDGEYDVVHGELVEPYTTNYEGEVVRLESVTEDIPLIAGNFNNIVPSITWGDHYTDKLYIMGEYSIVDTGNFTWLKIFGFNDSDTVIWQYGGGSTGDKTGFNGVIPVDVSYIRISCITGITTLTVIYNKKYTPNLIPSSSDGSLIFSMYAPSKAPAPASGTWDLKGLEFDNFHTYGMNNDVKPSEDSYVKVYNGKNLKLFQGNVYRNNPIGSVFIDKNQTYRRVLSPIYLPKGSHTYAYSNGNNSTMYYVTELNGSKTQSLEYGHINITSEEGGYAHLTYITNDPNYPEPMEWIKIDDVYYMLENIELITLEHGSSGFEYSVYDYIDGEVDSRETSMMIMDIKSLSMPARYDDYNITIKNVNISPKTHNTMLYPLLVNEDNPIEGKLDYTNYVGNNLSWSFAYVNMNKVNIVQPKDELLNTYEYRYNAFYETEYEFDDPNEVLRYITSSSNLLPTFNEGFTYTYDKLDNNDGTYIYRIYANDPTLLTSFELEKVPYLRITNAENLLSPIDLTKYETVSISESYYDITELYFREATNLTLTNMPYLERVIYLPNDEYEVFEIINVVNSKDYIITTSECPRLTTFMTTASHRESYNNEDVIAEVITELTNTDNELFTNEYVFSKTYWEEDGTEIQGSVNLLHYEIPSIEDSVKAIHMVQGLDSTNRVTFFNDDKFISCEVITTACELDFKLHRNCNRIVFICEREGIVSSVVESILTTTLVKEYGSVEPNIIFNANTLDISNTQFTDVKLLCTTDLNVLKLPTTVRNFYCDSSFDLDTDYLTDGEYNVIHGEFVEPYTTDYEGEIVYNVTSTELFTLESGTYPWNDRTYHTDFIRVAPNTSYTSNMVATGFWCVTFLAEDKETVVYKYVSSKGTDITAGNGVTPNDAHYMVFSCLNNNNPLTLEYIKSYTPNLIPSSSDGSLIFSMYAPSKAPAPASNTWDLYGLEFDNFHTFGMNNDVKGDISYIKVGNHSELIKQRGNISTTSDAKFGDIAINTAERITVVGFELPTQESSPHVITTSNGKGYRLLTDEGNDGTQNSPGYFYTSGNSYTWGSNNMHKFILELNGLDIEWINIDGVYYYIDKIRDLGIINPTPNYSYVVNLFDYATSFTKISEYSFKIDEIKSLSMSSRYNNYNVTIKNANISPKTHNTMLYPLLVNEDNPIEGKLDYTDYNGEYLSWSFAYTNTNKVNIIQPKDELLNSYEYRYNAFYRTEYEFNNPNEVMEYTTTSSNLLPIFNEGFTYAYDKIDNDDGTYTYKIYANDISLLTSFELEKVPYLRIVNAENLVLPIDLTEYEVIEIDNSYNSITELYFRDSTNLTLSNMSNLERVIYLPNDEYEVFELINVANAPDYKVTTFNCPKLSTFMTTAPYRESYNNCGMKDKEIIHTEELLDGTYEMGGFWGDTGGYMSQTNYRMYEANIPSDADELILNIEMTGAGTTIILHYFEDDIFISRLVNTSASWSEVLTKPSNCNKVIISVHNSYFKSVSLTYNKVEIVQVKDCGNIQPNTTFAANSIDISNTQFTDVKLLCTTDTNVLKLPTTVKNFYCDSSFDLDTDYLEDGEYDVVHGELVEPYTTDYEGEVVRIRNVTMTLLTAKGNLGENIIDNEQIASDGKLITHNSWVRTDYIPYYPNTSLSVKCAEMTNGIRVNFYAEDKSLIKYDNTLNGRNSITSPLNTSYVIVSIRKDFANAKPSELLLSELYTPNLIPSSADGSLIFSMYTPSNAVAPASGTWDLKGLEFDNFHTYGMNNDVKIIAEKTQNINFAEAIELDNLEFDLNIELIASANDDRGYIRLCDGFKERVIYINRKSIAYATNIDSWFFTNLKKVDSSSVTKLKLSVSEGILTYYLDGVSFYSTNLNNIPYYNDTIYNKISIELVNDGGFDSIISSKTLTSPSNDINDINSLSMPARYDDYNITIKNANISPKTHNTMLYPLLVNEDKPITGTLDYTNYAGKHLSWSFAHTDEEHVNIIQPKDELINSYKYKYNTYYDTEYEFDNPYEIARYTSSASGVLPNFNAEFTYTYDEKDNRDGTYTTKIYADSMDNLPTSISFNGKITLLTVDKLNTSRVTFMASMFRGCTNLTSLDLSEFDTSKVTNMGGMFQNCGQLTSLDLSGFDTGNVTDMGAMFSGCGGLTSLDVSGFDTSEVTQMGNMFTGCNNLTSLDLSEFDTSEVTNMNGMFNGCNNLTSLDLSGFDTSNVTVMGYIFNNCKKLTSLDLSGFDTKNVTDMGSVFYNCTSLTSLDLSGFDTSSVTNMGNMFFNCNNLTSLDLSSFDTGEVTNMASMFQNCSELTSLNVSNFNTGKVTNISDMFNGCQKLTEITGLEKWDTGQITQMSNTFNQCYELKSLQGIENWNVEKLISLYFTFRYCKKITSLDLSNWNITSTLENIGYTFMLCESLEYLDLSNWDVSNVTAYSACFSFGTPNKIKRVSLNGWTKDKIELVIPTLPTKTEISTVQGSVIIDETILPSGWVYDNVLEVAIYTCSTSGVLPNFNTEFTYTHAEVDNGNGTYTTKISADSLDNLPTNMSFYTKSALLSVERMNVSKVTSGQGMFYQCFNVTHINSSNWDTSSMTSMNNMFNGCNNLTSLDVSGFDTSNVTNMFGMFSGCSGLTSLDVSGFVTSNVTTMANMFNGCKKLTSLDLSGFDTKNVTTMNRMFDSCNSLTALDVSGFDTSSVTDMQYMFVGCNNLTSLDVSGFDTSKVTVMLAMFSGCNSLTTLDVSGFDTSSVNNMNNMFQNCNNLTSLDVSGFDTSKVDGMNSMFFGCNNLTSLDVSEFDTSNVLSMGYMFNNCRGLTSLDVSGFDTSKVTNMESMFRGCISLIEIRGIENWVTSKMENVNNMFNACSVTSLDLSNWDTSSLINCSSMFYQSNIVSLDLSGWDTSKVTNSYEMIVMCSKMMTLKLEGWSTIDFTKQIKLWSDSVTGKVLCGTIIIDESTLPSGWTYSNSLEVAIYTCSTSGVLPIFNTEFTYTHSETSNEDGTYTTKVVADSIDNLPTSISFYNIRELIEVHKLNTSEVTTMQGMFQHCKTLTTINSSSWDTSKVTNMKYMFNNCSALTTLDVSNWNTKNVVSMYGTFSGCTQLTTLDVGKWNTKNVDTMQLLFSDCPNITTLDVSNFDTSKVINMSSMFNGCLKLTTLDVSNFDTSNVTNMSMMFRNCNKLIALNVSNFDTSKVTNMGEMFSGCNVLSIEGLGNWDVKNVTDMGSMFLHCRGITSLLEISDWDTSSLKSLYRTFMGCTELIELDVSNWNASKLETLLETFYSCSKIISFNLGNWDCRRVTSINAMFQGCSSLSSVILPKEVRKGCNAGNALRNCTNLKEVALPKGIGNISHMLNNCYNLEKAVIPLDDITDVQDTTFNNCRALVNIDWVGDLSNNFNIINKPGEHVTTESDVHELMTNLGDLKKDKIKISLSKRTIKVNDAEKTIE